MDLNLDGKVAIITGGSKGIGLATASALADEGVLVVVGARTETEELRRLRENRDVHYVGTDLATAPGVERLVSAAAKVRDGVDILVNNVARSEPAERSVDFTDEQWRRIFDATFFSAVRTVRASLPHLQQRPGSTIINISSVNSKLATGTVAPYCAAKAALTNLSKALAEDLTPLGIRVNTISPGPVHTPLWTAHGGFAELLADQAGTTVEDVMDRLLPESMAITTGRVSQPEEIASLVTYLASERAANITGADYVIDGGMLKSAA